MGLRSRLAKSFDTGLAWALRRIANPLDQGSIPSRVSIYMDRYQATCTRYALGACVADWLIAWRGRGAFASGFNSVMARAAASRAAAWPPSSYRLHTLCLHHHTGHVAAATERSEMRDKLIAAQKELSALKRGKKKGAADV